MSKFLAIDLGKFKSVTCLLETDTNETEFWTMATDRQYLETVLKKYDPHLVVIEACAIAGWVHDVCTSQGYRVLVCNPAQEPWKWKHLKRKTDRDDMRAKRNEAWFVGESRSAADAARVQIGEPATPRQNCRRRPAHPIHGTEAGSGT